MYVNYIKQQLGIKGFLFQNKGDIKTCFFFSGLGLWSAE